MALNEDAVNEAVSTIKTLHSEFVTFREDQKGINAEQRKINAETAQEITDFKVGNAEKAGDIKSIKETQERMLKILERTPSEFRAWLSTLSPYIIIIGGGAFLYYLQKGGAP